MVQIWIASFRLRKNSKKYMDFIPNILLQMQGMVLSITIYTVKNMSSSKVEEESQRQTEKTYFPKSGQKA